MFSALTKKIDRISKLSENDLMKYLSENDGLKEEIIYLNTYGQLYEGIDSKGGSLGTYTPYTIKIKRSKGQITDHVTLKDTGEFYNSFTVSLNNDYDLQITAQPIKDDTDLTEKYGEAIIGLSEENIARVRQMVKFIALNFIKQRI